MCLISFLAALAEWKHHRLWSQAAWIQILPMPLASCVILGMIVNLPVPQFPHLWNGKNHGTCLLPGFWEDVTMCQHLDPTITTACDFATPTVTTLWLAAAIVLEPHRQQGPDTESVLLKAAQQRKPHGWHLLCLAVKATRREQGKTKSKTEDYLLTWGFTCRSSGG